METDEIVHIVIISGFIDYLKKDLFKKTNKV